MVLVCPGCKNQVTLDDASVPEGVFKVRCKGCGKIITSQRHPEQLTPQPPSSVSEKKAVADPGISPAIEAFIKKEIAASRKEILNAMQSLFRGTGIAPGGMEDRIHSQKALICSGDPATLQTLTLAAKAMGYQTETTVTAADSLKNLDSIYSLVLIDPSFSDDLEAAKKLIGRLNARKSVERRQTFVVLISSAQKTLDGNAAFMNGVNLIVNKADLTTIEASIMQSQKEFQQMYAAYREVAEKS
jgi:predicted Zn finger-like uncharacterized protein